MTHSIVTLQQAKKIKLSPKKCNLFSLRRLYLKEQNILNEEQLLKDIENDPQKFGLVYEAFYNKIFGYVYRRTTDYEAAGDITAETFLKAYANIGKFKWRNISLLSKLVKKETLQKAFTRYKLTNGKETNYGYGWRFGFIQGSPDIWHGGLINGFKTVASYLPQEEVYVVVLSNCDCSSPEILTEKLAAIAIGKPYAFTEISIADSVLQTYAGVYENKNGDQLVISEANGTLYVQRGRAPKVRAKAFKKDHFFFDGPMITMEFTHNKSGKADTLIMHSRTANESWARSDKPVLTQTEIKVDDQILEMYTGEYEVGPQFTFTVTKENGRMFVQATGQEKLEMFAETNNKFFLKVNDARFEFVNESGKITKVILKQGGRTAEAMKIK